MVVSSTHVLRRLAAVLAFAAAAAVVAVPVPSGQMQDRRTWSEFRRWSRQCALPHARSDQQVERRAACSGVDVSDAGYVLLRLQPVGSRQRDVRARPQQRARGAERDDGPGALGPREPARHRAARHQLLGEQGSPRPSSAVPSAATISRQSTRAPVSRSCPSASTAPSICARGSAGIRRRWAARSQARQGRSSRT